MDFNLQDYAAMQELQHGRTKGWSTATALWVIVAVIVIAFFVFGWTNSCNEKVRLATNISELTGRINALEPAVVAQGNNLYSLNGVTAATVQGVSNIKDFYGAQLYELNDTVFYGRRRFGAPVANNNGREFTQTSTYNLASQNVSVTESCGGSGCNCG
jgi:outer membrane murein-binding lipoprotein Lpp